MTSNHLIRVRFPVLVPIFMKHKDIDNTKSFLLILSFGSMTYYLWDQYSDGRWLVFFILFAIFVLDE